MRVTSERIDGLRDDRGAAAVIVAICLVMLLGFGAFAVDAGSLWESRRNAIVATDAAALAAAKEKALENVSGCPEDIAADYVDRNGAIFLECEAESTSAISGWVRVDAEIPVSFTFAGVIGFDGADAFSSTTAEYNSPTSAAGLRPYGLCEKDANLGWIGSGTPPSGVHTFSFSGVGGGDCGDAAGNWGALEMAPSPTGRGQGECHDANSFGRCVREGVDRPVSIGDEIGGAPGADLCNSNHVVQGITQLITDQTEIGLPVYDQVTGQGNNAEFRISAFVGVRIIAFTPFPAGCSITVEFTNVVVAGAWEESGRQSNVLAIRICAVEETSQCG